MQSWALCFVCLYIGIELFNWVTGLHWLAELALPMSVLAGLSLAIASTPTLATMASPEVRNSLVDIPPSTDSDLSDVASKSPQPPNPSQPSEPSISFTINKNVRPF